MAIDQTHEKYVKITPLSHVFTGMSIVSIICSITRKSLEQQHTQNITHTHFEHHTRTHEHRYMSDTQDVRDDQLKDFKKFQYSMCSEMTKLVRMFNSVEEVDNEMMSGLFKSCGQLMIPKGRLMRRSVIDLAVSYREQKEASFELNTLALEPLKKRNR